MRKIYYLMFISLTILWSCSDDDDDNGNGETPDPMTMDEDPTTFSEIGMISIGGEGAAEISAWDPSTNQLFVVNNEDDSKIDIIDISNPASPSFVSSVPVSSYGDGVNSVAVSNGLLAAAIEADPSQDPGVVVIWTTSDLAEQAVVTAGALPDMVTFTPDGASILVANEGEPSDDYLNDPEGSVTIISVSDYSSRTVSFTGLSNPGNGFRVFGPNATLAQDVEPEYIAVSDDSRTAYVALQENNGLAIIDIASGSVSLIGLGTKDYTLPGNEIDPSDEDGTIEFKQPPFPIVGMYQPDAIDAFTVGGQTYVITANEGDAREYIDDQNDNEELDDDELGFIGEDRVKDVELDPSVYTDAESFQAEEAFGRLKLALSEGQNANGQYELIHSYGARSFSIWNGTTGGLIFDSGNEMEVKVNDAGLYADGRSDDKGIEPEGVVVGNVGNSIIAFIGLERVDAVAVYDVTDPSLPSFIKIMEAGDAPEGLVFIPASESPNERSILVVSSEDDGTVKLYSTN
jgi:hypothetical protein